MSSMPHLPPEKFLVKVTVVFFAVKNRLFFLHPAPKKKVKSSFEFCGKFQLGKCSRKASQREIIIEMLLFQDVFAEFALNVGVVECNYNPFSVTTWESYTYLFPMFVFSFVVSRFFLFWVGHFQLFFRWDSRMPHEVHWFETSHIEQQLFTW